MKTPVFLMLAVATVGCSSTSEKHEMFTQSVTACDTACKNHPAISEVSSTAGGGAPLLFMGGMEIKCKCHRPIQ